MYILQVTVLLAEWCRIQNISGVGDSGVGDVFRAFYVQHVYLNVLSKSDDMQHHFFFNLLVILITRPLYFNLQKHAHAKICTRKHLVIACLDIINQSWSPVIFLGSCYITLSICWEQFKHSATATKQHITLPCHWYLQRPCVCNREGRVHKTCFYVCMVNIYFVNWHFFLASASFVLFTTIQTSSLFGKRYTFGNNYFMIKWQL